MMSWSSLCLAINARLEVNDGLGQRIVPITKALLCIGRRTESDLRLVGSDVSREHAEIVKQNGDWMLRDKGSRYGTFVNGESITEHKLAHGDRVQFGRASGADVVFLTGEGLSHTDRSHASAVNDLRQLAALLEGAARARLGPRARRSAGARARCRHRRGRRRARLHHAGATTADRSR